MPQPRPILPQPLRARLLAGGAHMYLEPSVPGKDDPSRATGDRMPFLEPWAAYWGSRHPGGRIVHGFGVPQANGGIALATPSDPLHVHYADQEGPYAPTDFREPADMPDWALRAALVVESAAPTTLRRLHGAEAPGVAYDDWLADAAGQVAQPAGEPPFRPGPDTPLSAVTVRLEPVPAPSAQAASIPA